MFDTNTRFVVSWSWGVLKERIGGDVVLVLKRRKEESNFRTHTVESMECGRKGKMMKTSQVQAGARAEVCVLCVQGAGATEQHKKSTVVARHPHASALRRIKIKCILNMKNTKDT